MTIPTLPTLPTAPARTDPPATFVTRADAFLAAIVTFQTSMNLAIVELNVEMPAAVAASASAVISAATATAAAASAIAGGASSIWVSGTTYAIGDIRFSTIDFFNYRRRTAGAGTTDPQSDPTNWLLISPRGSIQIADASPATGSVHTFDFSVGQMQQVTCPASGTLTIAFSNFPETMLDGFLFQLVNGGNSTITWPAGLLWPNGVYPVLTVAGTDYFCAFSDKDGVVTISLSMPNIGSI